MLDDACNKDNEMHFTNSLYLISMSLSIFASKELLHFHFDVFTFKSKQIMDFWSSNRIPKSFSGLFFFQFFLFFLFVFPIHNLLLNNKFRILIFSLQILVLGRIFEFSILHPLVECDLKVSVNTYEMKFMQHIHNGISALKCSKLTKTKTKYRQY